MADRKLLRGRYVWTGAEQPDERVVEDGAVVVDGSVIREVGRASDLIPKYPDAELFGSGEHVVLPGLVNSHHHGYGLTTLELGIPDDWLERWLAGLSAPGRSSTPMPSSAKRLRTPSGGGGSPATWPTGPTRPSTGRRRCTRGRLNSSGRSSGTWRATAWRRRGALRRRPGSAEANSWDSGGLISTSMPDV